VWKLHISTFTEFPKVLENEENMKPDDKLLFDAVCHWDWNKLSEPDLKDSEQKHSHAKPTPPTPERAELKDQVASSGEVADYNQLNTTRVCIWGPGNENGLWSVQ